jgi:hypothetical protein
VHFDSMIIMDAFAEIGRPPPQPKAMIDTLPLLTQCFGPRAGDMKVYTICCRILFLTHNSLSVLKLLTVACKLGKLFWSREAKAQVRGVLSAGTCTSA